MNFVKIKINKPIISLLVVFIMQSIGAFLGLLQSINNWYDDNDQNNFNYDYKYFYYTILFSVIWLIACIFAKVILEGNSNNEEFFSASFLLFIILSIVFLFGLFSLNFF